MAKRKFYVVWEGVNPGIYDSWAECKQQVVGYTGAKYKSFDSMADATEAFRMGAAEVLYKKSKKSGGASSGSIIQDSLSVDAACSGNPGPTEYQGVYTKTGERIFHMGPLQDANNNVGEFLALIHALALLKKRNDPRPIYSDSITAMAWVRNKKMNSTIKRTSRNEPTWELIDRGLLWLKNNTYTTQIYKWDTPKWGEIPADFGRK